MKAKRILIVVFMGLVITTAALVWASESAPSNTVGFFNFELETSNSRTPR